ncbi:ABC transporter permease [Luteitalea sp.]|uniref:ABC transporter permease n=1 Tax=Luteitalea sp. TaxID=2004800 RepID=UPI00345AD2BC
MTDWRAYVREHICPADRSATIPAAVIDEIATQLQDVHDAVLRAGGTPEEAVERARREVSDWSGLAREIAHARTPALAGAGPLLVVVDELLKRLPFGDDGLRRAASVLWRSRAFVALTILVVALTVGGATALLQVVDAAFLKPLPFPQADRMVVVLPFSIAEGKRFGRLPGEFVEALDGLVDAPTSVWPGRVTAFTTPERPQIWEGAMVSVNATRLFGIVPVAGRLLNDEDFRTTEGPLPTMIEEGLWRRAFGGSHERLGRVIKGDRQDLHIVGVYKADLVMPSFAKVLAPTFIAPDRDVTTEWMLGPIGRLRAGLTREEAERTIAARVAAVHADNTPIREVRAEVVPLREYMFGHDRTFFRLMAGAAIALLLVGTLSLAVLHIARLQRQLPEVAVRLGLGDTPARLRRRLLAHGMLATAIGVPVVVGTSLGIAHWLDVPHTMDRSLAMLASTSPRRVMVWGGAQAIAVSLVGLVLAVSIALRRRTVTRLRLVETLHWRGSTRVHVALVATQAALAVVLLVAATAAVRTSAAIARESTGIAEEDLYFVGPRLPLTRYQSTSRGEFWRAVVDEVAADPRIMSVAAGMQVPVSGDPPWASIRGREGSDYMQRGGVVPMSREFLSTLGARLVAGRVPSADEEASSAMVAVINETGARAFFGNASPLGQSVDTPWFGAPYRIVGVVRDIRFSETVPAIPMLYAPMWRQRLLPMTLAVRTRLSREEAQGAVEDAIRRVEPLAAVPLPQPFSDRLRGWRARPRFFARVFTAGGVVALLLTALSTIAIIRTVVAGRQRELGIRLALGEPIARAVRRIMRAVVIAATLGACLGVAAARYGSHLAQAHLSDLEMLDAQSHVVPVVLVIGLVVTATYIACRHAVATTPMDLLRQERRT